MNRYFFIHRLTGPAVLLLLGVIALLHQAGIASWDLFVPLLLILIGVLKLVERALLASDPSAFSYPYQVPPQPYGPGATTVNAAAEPGTQFGSGPGTENGNEGGTQ
jgi:hypothetical protein